MGTKTSNPQTVSGRELLPSHCSRNDAITSMQKIAIEAITNRQNLSIQGEKFRLPGSPLFGSALATSMFLWLRPTTSTHRIRWDNIL